MPGVEILLVDNYRHPVVKSTHQLILGAGGMKMFQGICQFTQPSVTNHSTKRVSRLGSFNLNFPMKKPPVGMMLTEAAFVDFVDISQGR